MKKSKYIIAAGIINLFTAFVHLIAGQLDLVNPLLDSNLTQQAKVEWLAVWHLITVILFLSSFYLIRSGWNIKEYCNVGVIKLLGILYCLFSIVFILSSIYMQTLAPQWIILFPIGILALLGIRRMKM